MSNKINTPVTPPQEPTAPKKERRGRVPLALLNTAATLLLTACGNDTEAGDGGRVYQAPQSSAPAAATTEAPAPSTKPSTVTEAAPNATLQEQMTARAEQGAAELSQTILSIASTLSPEAAPVEPAGDDGSWLQHARIDVPAEDGTITHYELSTQFTDPGAGLPSVVENVSIEVDLQDSAGNITATPYWLMVMKDPQGDGRMVSLLGAGEGGPFAVSDDFSGAPGLNPGERPIATLADEEAVFAQAARVLEDARTGMYSHGESSPF